MIGPKCTKTDKNAKMEKNNHSILVQVAWTNYTVLGRGHYKLLLGRTNLLLDYSQGDLVGIKSKCCGVRRNVYSFCDVDGIRYIMMMIMMMVMTVIT